MDEPDMQLRSIDSEHFVTTVRPALERRDADELARTVKERWTKDELCQLVSEGTLDARKVVCLTLGLVGCSACAECLTRALLDEDEVVVELAEHALWSIWFRCGDAKAIPNFKRGLAALTEEQYRAAIDHFSFAAELDPTFPEALNQRAIAYYMMENWPRALADYQRVVGMLPIHFGALAGMGHCYAQMGDFHAAAAAYRRALAVHPRMKAVIHALANIDSRKAPTHVPA